MMGNKGKMDAKGLGALSAVVLLFVLVFVAHFVYGVTPVVVDGISMLPNLHTGDVAISYKEPYGKIAIGNIVVYNYNGMLIIHRVVAKYYHKGILCFVIKGDNNPVPDPGYPQYCGYYSYKGYMTGGVPYWEVKGVILTSNGKTPIIIPYIGSMILAIKGTGNDVI
ncbi:MAG: signal peptidase I [Caldisphaeraceae archaeon]|nr:signal peptidase I [Caldisphaeraceae archaeon]